MPFSPEDADLFFGRESDITRLCNAINDERVVVVIGPSGCGKTSLLRAGVFPELKRRGYPVVYSSVVENVYADSLASLQQHELQQLGNASTSISESLATIRRGYPEPGQGSEQDYPVWGKLWTQLSDAFSAEELQNLSFELGLDHEDYAHSTKSGMARELIRAARNRGRITQLISACIKYRPQHHWPNIDTPSGTASQSNARGGLKRPAVLIIDQFERALNSTHESDDLFRFLKEVYTLVSSTETLAKIVIAIRADWQHDLETIVRHLRLDITVNRLTHPVDYLTRITARDAIIKPLLARNYEYDEAVIDDVLDGLAASGKHSVIEKQAIQPAQLQLVVDSLLRSAETKGNIGSAFRLDHYRETGGAKAILASYLETVLAGRSDAGRLLARLVSDDGLSTRTIPEPELLSASVATNAKTELEDLIRNGLVQIHETQPGNRVCRLAHDYLAITVHSYIHNTPDQLAWKIAEDWLSRATADWLQHSSSDRTKRPSIDPQRYEHILDNLDRLALTQESRTVGIAACMQHGLAGLDRWIGSAGRSSDEFASELVTTFLCSPDEDVAQSSLKAIQRATHKLPASARNDISNLIRTRQSHTRVSPNQERRFHEAIWALKPDSTATTRAREVVTHVKYTASDHRKSLTIGTIATVFVAIIVASAGYLSSVPPGTWSSFVPPKAGPVRLVGFSSSAPGDVFALVYGGTASRDQVSLFLRRKGQTEWALQSKNFTAAAPTTMLVLGGNGSNFTIYGAFDGTGILRSTDSGQNWQRVNRGLTSYAILSLEGDAIDPSTIYAASADYRGVLISRDNGDSWNSLDHKGDIVGASITTLRSLMPEASNKRLIAGTADGRIYVHTDDTGWQLSSNAGRGSISVISSSNQKDGTVYAATNQGYILRSQDAGDNFDIIGQIPNRFSISALSTSQNDNSTIAASTFGNGGFSVWFSKDGGANWSPINDDQLPRTYINQLAYDSTDTLFAATASGLFVLKQEDSNWTRTNIDAPVARIDSLKTGSASGSPIYLISDATVLVNQNRDLQTWTQSKGLKATTVRAVVPDPNDPRVAYAGTFLLGSWSIYITRDGGLNWSLTKPPPISDEIPDTIALAASRDASGNTVLYASLSGCGIIRSDDQGNSWTTFGRAKCSDNNNSGMPLDAATLVADPDNPQTLYAARAQFFYVSKDGGQTWATMIPDRSSVIVDFALDRKDPNKVIAATSSSGLLITRDSGKTWSRASSNIALSENMRTVIQLPDPSLTWVVAAADGGIWQSSSGGEKWESIRGNLSLESITTLIPSNTVIGSVIAGSGLDGIAQFTPHPHSHYWPWREK